MRASTFTFLLALLTVGLSQADDSGWPRVVETGEGRITIYQPQVESLTDTRLEARAALAVHMEETDGPVFGAAWYQARIVTDRDERLVYVEDVTVPMVRFPDASEEQKEKLARFLERQIPASNLTLSLDQLLAGLDLEGNGVQGLKSDAPVILFSTEPALLVTLDGEPVLQDMESGKGRLERVVNTPFLMVRLIKDDRFFLSGGGRLWYEAEAATGPWEPAAKVPGVVRDLVPAEEETPEGEPPIIYVATEPTELVVSAGSPTWTPVEGLDLLYMDNTDSDVFLDISGQHYYLLLSGRWYRAPSVSGELVWESVPNDKLPGPFSKIPEESVNGSVLPHVAGTMQAREAVLDSTIPQTAAIRRDAGSITVAYDGSPEFVDVEGVAGLQYAVNTPTPVFRAGEVYYACEQAVWYRSRMAAGPWQVATEVSALLYQIPPSNPHYNVIYVKVYETTPEVVYVGYTAGYTHSYHHHGCLVYGTGWWYRPWWGYYYYPRPVTYGFRVSYNPWYGWGFGFTWSNGPFTVSIGRYGGYPGGWFGPVGYRPYYRPPVVYGYRKTNININTGDINIGGGSRPGSGNRPGAGPRPETRPSNNIYDRAGNRERNAQGPQTADRQRPGTAGPGRNDVFTDRNGNVYRRDEQGRWQQRDQGQWKSAENLDRAGTRDRSAPSTGGGQRPATPSQRPETTRPATPSPQPGTRPSTGSGTREWTPPASGSRTRPSTGGSAARPGLERSHQSRQRGSQRANSYQRSRPSAGARGGGRRR